MAVLSEIEVVEQAVALTQGLASSDNVMVARAAERVTIILAELLVEVAPTRYQGPWQVRAVMSR